MHTVAGQFGKLLRQLFIKKTKASINSWGNQVIGQLVIRQKDIRQFDTGEIKFLFMGRED